jgi:hypothetical protein
MHDFQGNLSVAHRVHLHMLVYIHFNDAHAHLCPVYQAHTVYL